MPFEDAQGNPVAFPGASGSATPDTLADTLRGVMLKAGTGYQDYVAQPLTGAVEGAIGSLPFSGDPGTQQAIRRTAEFVVPQTPTSAGIVAGGLASGGLGIVPGIVGAAAGGMVGGALEGAPLSGAGLGATAGGIGQGLGYLGGVVRRHFFQRGADEANVGRAIGEISPTLGPMDDAIAMQDRLKGGAGREALRDAYVGQRGAVEAGLQGQGLVAAPGGALEKLTGKPSFSFDEAAQAIESLRAGTHTVLGALRGSEKAAMQRALRAEAVDELTATLRSVDPALATMFRDAERAYGTGWELLRLFRTRGVLDPKVGGLNMPALQALMGERQDVLERMLGPAGWSTLKRAVYRGGAPPAMDRARGLFGPGTERLYGVGLPGGLGASSGFRIPGPMKYVGPEQLGMPAWPATAAMGVAIPNLLNPYAERP